MNYKFKQYEVKTKKEMYNDETRIITLSDLNWTNSITKYNIDDLIVAINDIMPKYLFILGNITNYNYLQDKDFQKKLAYFFDLLSNITRTYLVFGKKDYEIIQDDNKSYTDIENLTSIYNNFNVYPINNSFYSDNDINILGLNLEPNKHYSIEDKKKKIEELLTRMDKIIDNDKLNILMTHSDISALKNERKLLTYFDLIFSKANNPITSNSLFKRKTDDKDEIFNNFIIENTGLHTKGEMDLIKVFKKNL